MLLVWTWNVSHAVVMDVSYAVAMCSCFGRLVTFLRHFLCLSLSPATPGATPIVEGDAKTAAGAAGGHAAKPSAGDEFAVYTIVQLMLSFLT